VFGCAGDSVVAEFPSPVEAVRCAVDIQRELEARNADLPEDRLCAFASASTSATSSSKARTFSAMV
jgi:class 3 adenylate cyclase